MQLARLVAWAAIKLNVLEPRKEHRGQGQKLYADMLTIQMSETVNQRTAQAWITLQI